MRNVYPGMCVSLMNLADSGFFERHKQIGDYNVRYLDSQNSGSNTATNKILILLHGPEASSSTETWSKVALAISRYFRVVIPDIRDFRYSGKPSADYTVDFFVESLNSFMEGLNSNYASFIGSFFGSFLATEYAMKFPSKVSKLILVSSAGAMQTSTQNLDEYIMAALYPTYENVAKAFSQLTFNSESMRESTIKDFINQANLPNAKYTLMSTLLGIRHSGNVYDRLSKIDVPVLFIWGNATNMIPLEDSAKYAEISNIITIVMKGCGHMPYLEKPDEFTKICLNFLLNRGAKEV
jgi:2-hydroxy-6-oxonona-2,4-dienedioate hydrolase